MELYVLGESSGTLWNFLVCFMERNNYDADDDNDDDDDVNF